MLVISIVSGALLGLISGAIYVIVKLPPIIVSLGVTLFYEGMAFALTDGYGVSFVANKELTSFPGVLNYVLVIVIGLVLFIAIFDYKCRCIHSADCYCSYPGIVPDLSE